MALEVKEPSAVIEKNPTHALAVKNVLFATDFSAASEAALPYAVALCRRFGSTLHMVHVLSEVNVLMATGGVDYVSMGTIYEDANTEAKERMEQLAANLHGIDHHSYLRHGEVWSNLAGVMRDKEVDLIVLGTHGRTGFGKLLLGSVAEDILRHARCPALTVGPRISERVKLPELGAGGAQLAPPELELRQIVCATNLDSNALAVASDAVRLAEEFQARLTLLHVMEDYAKLGNRPGPIDDSLQRLQNLVPSDAALAYVPEVLLEYGSVASTILKVAADREADLLVLGAHAAADMLRSTHLPWSTAHQVIVQAHCPVLTIRG